MPTWSTSLALAPLVFLFLFAGATVVLLVYYLVKKIDREREEDFEKRSN